MYYVYVLKSDSTGRAYIGHTDDLESRIHQHNSGMSKATGFVRDWRLKYSQSYSSRSLAMKREKFLKSGDGRKVLRLKGII